MPPIDIVCFGRPRVGKSTLLSALTGHQFNASDSAEHVTTEFKSFDTTVIVGDSKYIIRHWDTVGMDDISMDAASSLWKNSKVKKSIRF